MFDLIPFGGSDRNLFHYFDDMEKNFFSPSSLRNISQFRTDIVDKGDSIELQADLPGFTKEDIKIELDNNYLTISAEKNEETDSSKGSYIRKERRYGSFTRRFDVTGIETENITASCENGVLKLELPKIKPAPLPPTRQITIQ